MLAPQPLSARSSRELACSRFVAWGNAYLRGATSLDEAAAAIAPSVVVGLPDGVVPGRADPADPGLRAACDSGRAPAHAMTVALGLMRARGVTALRLALPVPGDPLGLVGPAAVNTRALEVGAAVLTCGSGSPRAAAPVLCLLPWPDDDGDVWRAERCSEGRADVPSLPEAERALAEAILESSTSLSSLEVARPDARLADAVRQAERSSALAPGFPARAHRVLAQAIRLRAALTLANDNSGGAISAAETRARAAAMRPLEHAVRRAIVAAHEAV